MARRIIENINIEKEYLNILNWPKVDVHALDDKDINIYSKRKKAVEMYMKNNFTLQSISDETGISIKTILRLIKRCFIPDSYGVIWGYRALIPGKHIKEYKRSKSTSNINKDNSRRFQGAFSQLLENYPDIKELLIDLYLGKGSHIIREPIMSKNMIHIKFINACRAAGIKNNEYPFNTQYLARRSVYSFLSEIYNQYLNEASKRDGEEIQRSILTSGNNIVNQKKKSCYSSIYTSTI